MAATLKLPRCLKPFADVIAEVSDERRDGDGYWVYFVTGWIDYERETHCVHEDTPKECADRMKLGVVKCDNPRCCK